MPHPCALLKMICTYAKREYISRHLSLRSALCRCGGPYVEHCIHFELFRNELYIYDKSVSGWSMLCACRRPCVCVSFDEYLKRTFLFFDLHFLRVLPPFLLCLAVLYVITSKAKGKFTEHSAQFSFSVFFFFCVGRCFLFTLAHTSAFGNCPEKKNYMYKMKSD